MKTVQEINAAILGADLTLDDIRAINNAISYKWKETQRRATLSFMKGDRVEFTARSGSIVTGKVTKINQKTIGVRSELGVDWKVSPNLLRKAG